jgi:hypothetical protein
LFVSLNKSPKNLISALTKAAAEKKMSTQKYKHKHESELTKKLKHRVGIVGLAWHVRAPQGPSMAGGGVIFRHIQLVWIHAQHKGKKTGKRKLLEKRNEIIFVKFAIVYFRRHCGHVVA